MHQRRDKTTLADRVKVPTYREPHELHRRRASCGNTLTESARQSHHSLAVRHSSRRSRRLSTRAQRQNSWTSHAHAGVARSGVIRDRRGRIRHGQRRRIARPARTRHGDRISRRRRYLKIATTTRGRRPDHGGGNLAEAAVGVAVGLGRLGLATVGTILTWIIMSWVGRIEHRINAKHARQTGADRLAPSQRRRKSE